MPEGVEYELRDVTKVGSTPGNRGGVVSPRGGVHGRCGSFAVQAARPLLV
jgi:hypothetical protein